MRIRYGLYQELQLGSDLRVQSRIEAKTYFDAGFPSLFGLDLEEGHLPTFRLLLKEFLERDVGHRQNRPWFSIDGLLGRDHTGSGIF